MADSVTPQAPSFAETLDGHQKGRPRQLREDLLHNLSCREAKFPEVATTNDWYLALAHTVRDRVLERWIRTVYAYYAQESRTVVYLSAEFLMGPQLGNAIVNLGIEDEVRAALAGLGLDLDVLADQEEEPGLGNGGLGRLAACYMDSLATLEIPAIGYGVRYEYGIFDQFIRDGWQVEIADKWLRLGNPWEVPRPELALHVQLGGRTHASTDADGRYRVEWIPDRIVRGVPYDTPVLGYGVPTANLLRLWRAEAQEAFDFQSFNVGEYYRAVENEVESETITKVLYPNDEPEVGKRLRLQQQYFFVSCALQDMIRIYLQRNDDLGGFHEKYAAQLNDTHPAIAVPELMRLLVDEHGMEWEQAWSITTRTFAFTNHTLLPEALETWSLPLFAQILPRHLEIIFEINRRFLDEVEAAFPNDPARLARMSLIEEGGSKRVRMANLACVGSHRINGVAELHSKLLQRFVLRDFHELWPDKLCNKTNGVTPRRFLLLSNPGLAALISEAVGEGWVRDLEQLQGLEPFAEDAAFRERWLAVKRANKAALATIIERRAGVSVDPDSLFDIQVKRLHEYKRQHLNVLHILTHLLRLKQNPGQDVAPRTFVFGGKAAPGYFMAKLIIKLIHSVAVLVNDDADLRGRMRVAFLPDFNVKNAQPVYPAADLSEQISLAGKEASGTGNMKFSLNGALTIGTLDGANIEIRERVGADNFFVFGLTARAVRNLRESGYSPWEYPQSDPELKAVMDLLASPTLSGGDRSLFAPIVESLMGRDEYMLLADYRSYVQAQERVDAAYRDPERWARMSILNTARMGFFSSDRAIAEYCEDIWNVGPVHVTQGAP